MGFASVYRSLQDIFPQVDARLLRAVAIEHSKDADVAVEVVLSEVLPYMHKHVPLSALKNHGSGGSSDGEEKEEPSDLLRRQRANLDTSNDTDLLPRSTRTEDGTGIANTKCSDAIWKDESLEVLYQSIDGNDKICGSNGSEELISMAKIQEISDRNVLAPSYSSILNESPDGECTSHACVEAYVDMEDNKLISFECQRSGNEVVPKQNLHILSTPSICDLAGVNKSSNELHADWENFHGSMPHDFDTAINGNIHKLESYSDNSGQVEVGNSAVQLVVEEQKPNSDDCGAEFNSQTSGTDGEKPGTSFCMTLDSKQDCSDSEMANVEYETTLRTILSQSGQNCRADVLDGIIEEAKNNKKTLFIAMESVISKMREVELHEMAAEEAKQEAARGGLDILLRLEELKQMLVFAKEANDMHAGEVYGEKAILTTEVKELQSRLLNLSDERDKSLSTLDEMLRTLEARLAAAEEVKRAAILEKEAKEESAQCALAEQEAIMEKVIQESKRLQQEAEENAKLREFLMDRGHVVDMLQGEISVICQDVRLLKEKFDDCVPLSKSISSSQTTCILASSSSSLKSMASDMVTEQGLSKSPVKEKPAPSVDGNFHKNIFVEERAGAYLKELSDDDWIKELEFD